MIETIAKLAKWKRRLTIECGLRKQDKSETIGEDIEVFSYRTGMSLGTEQRVQVRCSGEPMIEIHQDDRGYIHVEIQGIEAQGLRVKLSPLKGQKINELSLVPDVSRDFNIE
jgi:hypothetical protein